MTSISLPPRVVVTLRRRWRKRVGNLRNGRRLPIRMIPIILLAVVGRPSLIRPLLVWIRCPIARCRGCGGGCGCSSCCRCHCRGRKTDGWSGGTGNNRTARTICLAGRGYRTGLKGRERVIPGAGCLGSGIGPISPISRPDDAGACTGGVCICRSSGIGRRERSWRRSRGKRRPRG
jgi:hypothetical protein